MKLCMKYLLMETVRERESHFLPAREVPCKPLILNTREPGDLPRSRKQIYDIKKQMRKVDEIGELLQYTKNSEESIVLEHHEVPKDLWVLVKPHMTTDLSRFCTSDQLNHPLSVHPTFNFGKFEVTAFNY